MVRRYRMKVRSERFEETRRRIGRAVYELHSTIGPARATISGIAQQAGVDRVTVYRHFPDDRSLYRACLEHWTRERPLPDPESWIRFADGAARLRFALGEVYRHYEENEGLWSNGWRDLPRLPALMETDAPVFARFAAMQAALSQPWSTGPHAELASGWVAHALEFPTWESFVRRHGLTSGQLIDMVVQGIRCLAPGRGPSAGHQELDLGARA